MATHELAELARRIPIRPEDPEYDAARVCYNAAVDRRPAVIVRCAGPGGRGDRPSRYARAEGLEVAVRGGGHNPAGHCILDGGLVIDLSRMRRVDVDADPRIARAQGRVDLARLRHGHPGLRPR